MTQVAEYMVEKLGGKGNVVIIEGTAGAQTAIDRLKAINDVLAKNPDIKLLHHRQQNFSAQKLWKSWKTSSRPIPKLMLFLPATTKKPWALLKPWMLLADLKEPWFQALMETVIIKGSYSWPNDRDHVPECSRTQGICPGIA